MTQMHERLRRFHEAQRARGMSAAALAKLPKPPVFATPVELPPVYIATKRDVTNLEQQAKARASMAEMKREKFSHLAKQVKLEACESYRGETKQTQITRAKAITAIIAKVAQLEPYQLFHGGNKFRFARPRHIAIVLIGELTGMGRARAAGVFGFEDASTARYAAQRVAWHLQRGEPSTTYIYNESLRQIRERWPEYQIQEAA